MTDLRRLAEQAQSAIARRDWPKAVRTLQALVEASAQPSASLLYNLGLALKHKGDLDDAADWLGRALAAEPAHANARFELAAALMELGRHEAALEAFEACLAFSPKDGDALLNAARLALRLGRQERAVALAVRVAEVRPADPAASLLRAEIATERGALDEAEALFRHVFAQGDPVLRAAALAAMTHHAKGRVPLDPRVLMADAERGG